MFSCQKRLKHNKTHRQTIRVKFRWDQTYLKQGLAKSRSKMISSPTRALMALVYTTTAAASSQAVMTDQWQIAS